MRLEIENQDELHAAIAAVEELRKTKVRHIGLHARRYLIACHQSTREKIFADEWEKDNNPPSWLNGGHGTLQWLLCTTNVNSIDRELKPEEATVAATVIQWLGTNCGFCWLQETLKKITDAECL